MAPKKHARVLIAGGSVAGLTLANILEQNGIDYLVLEKYEKIAPDLGASIGLFPNGLRILDQIGVHDAVMKLAEGANAFQTAGIRDDKGRLVNGVRGFSQHFIRRTGFSPVFIDRQMLIQALYDNLKDKSKVLANKGVEHVSHISGGVRVATRGGDVFTAELLVGADGIHSKVRSEMWRIADSETPGYFPLKERDNVPTEYACIFGISKSLDKFPEQSTQTCQGNNYSYLIASGPGGRIYWFLFKKLDKIYRGLYDKIPRFTDAERDVLAKEHANNMVVDSTGLTFGELYANRTTATLQALPEVAFSKWYYGRIFTIGDAVHKFNPIGGQGGNSAIEDGAVLTNHLYKLIKSEEKASNFTDANIEAVFAATQAERYDRAANFVKMSHDMQSVNAKDKFMSKLVAKYMIPRIGVEAIMAAQNDHSAAAANLHMVDSPDRPHKELWWYGERPAQPFTAGATKLGRIIASMIFAVYTGWLALSMQHPDPSIPQPETFLGLEPRTHFTGIEPVDKIVTIASLTFADMVGWVDVGHSLQGLNLFFLLVPLFLVWYIEGNRYGSKGSLIAWASFWGFIIHPLTAAIAAPIYFLISIWSFSSGEYRSGVGRHIPTSTARAILPALFLGCAAPTALVFLPLVPKPHLVELIVLWGHASFLVGTLVFAFSKAFGAPAKRVATNDFDPSIYSSSELPHLRRAYKLTFAFSLLYHVPSILISLLSTDPKLSLARLLLPGVNLEEAPASFEAATFVFLKWDLLGLFWAIVLFGVYTAWDLRSNGLIATQEAVGVAVGFLVAQPLIGPGAALVGLWWWREGKLWGKKTVAREWSGVSEKK